MRKWLPIGVLGVAMMVTVFDTALLGVAITQLVEDLNTDVTGVQLLTTTFVLTIGAFLLTSGKIGDIIGRKRAFAVGAVIYAIGSAISVVAVSFWTALIGWAILKGIGAALMYPVIQALIPFNYEEKDRGLAFAMIGGIGGAAAALGLIVGGWVTTAFSWRVVHVVDVVLLVAAVVGLRLVTDSPPVGRQKIDVVGALLSIVGLGLIVYATVQSSVWGFVEPKDSPIEPFGFALTPFVLAAGALVLWGFVAWQHRRKSRGEPRLLRMELLTENRTLRSVLSVDFSQSVVIGGSMFILPMYLQVVVGEDALGTGLRLLPLSIALLFTSIGAASITGRQAPRMVVRVGLFVMAIGLSLALFAVDTTLSGVGFGIAMAVLGFGLGILASVTSAITQGAVGDRDRSEVGGVSASASKLGGAIGVALLGALLISSLSGAFTGNINEDARIPSAIAEDTAIALDDNVQFIPPYAVEEALSQTSLEPEVAAGILDSYETAQIQGMRATLLVAVILTLLAMFFARGLSSEKPRVVVPGQPTVDAL